MELPRSFGILVHPTSFPGPYPIGNLGDEARAFLHWLSAAGARWWQVLPLGPTGYGDSPYQSFSAFAGNPYLIDPRRLVDRGWLEAAVPPEAPSGRVDYGLVYRWIWPLLREAYGGFRARRAREDAHALAVFEREHAGWLEDYALFMALKGEHGGAPWWSWPEPLKRRDPAALAAARERLAEEAAFHRWTQWIFFSQWRALADVAHGLGLGLVGDMPIFVAHDSADVWAHPELFQLDEDLNPTAVAGVPPDYFSPTGQLWGNPLYDWEALRRTGFDWWIRRIRLALTLSDLVRIDHFRGFEAYWAVPAGAETAEHGRWEPAPGEELFRRVQETFGSVPILAEDLGLITPEVEALRDRFGLPGMKVLQFAFTGEDNPFLPHNYPESGNCVVYTGTHDNDTTRGWCEQAPAGELAFLRRYLEARGIPYESCDDAPWALIELALQSRCRMAVFPLQDPLGLGSEARMNFPSRPEGNWTWRFAARDLSAGLSGRLRALADRYDRVRRG
ncbi:4-alpha-glucanotransferase [Oceanithermus desulfurans]|uniref:4-alpha-glucanotransferase n=2 Tax=Oceanithermus desulfurans TaxID=227924 RepID=A0A511RLF7_9DEIN|nr:4-alpha-glucanotransferase [Oceanithermus desulfurans]MBB6028980.1 4-alpha-glucanotransferase [Oceanithermus desulfurans]GEM90499.1 4-alpha-glucanotransferase [Oceanithermus desulfurans NBRC 100063]